jgi:hypothetical protein
MESFLFVAVKPVLDIAGLKLEPVAVQGQARKREVAGALERNYNGVSPGANAGGTSQGVAILPSLMSRGGNWILAGERIRCRVLRSRPK